MRECIEDKSRPPVLVLRRVADGGAHALPTEQNHPAKRRHGEGYARVAAGGTPSLIDIPESGHGELVTTGGHNRQ